MAYDEELAERVRAALGSVKGVTEIKMFGGLCYTVGGNMAVGVTGEDLMVRMDPDAADAALAEPGARPMDFTGRRCGASSTSDPRAHARPDPSNAGSTGAWRSRHRCRPRSRSRRSLVRRRPRSPHGPGRGRRTAYRLSSGQARDRQSSSCTGSSATAGNGADSSTGCPRGSRSSPGTRPGRPVIGPARVVPHGGLCGLSRWILGCVGTRTAARDRVVVRRGARPRALRSISEGPDNTRPRRRIRGMGRVTHFSCRRGAPAA